MADDGPQLEDGYTRFANEWLEALIRASYPGSLKAFVLAIARETWGWGAGGEDNPFRAIPANRLAELLGVSVRQVQKLREDGVRHNLIEIEPGEHSDTCSYRVQKRYMDWILWQRKGTWNYEPRRAQGTSRGAANNDGRVRSEQRRAQDSEQRRALPLTTKKGTSKERVKERPSEEFLQQQLAELRDGIPADHLALIDEFLEICAAENESKKISPGRCVNETRRLLEARTELSPAPWAYGMDAACRKEAPNINYVKKAAASWDKESSPAYKAGREKRAGDKREEALQERDRKIRAQKEGLADD